MRQIQLFCAKKSIPDWRFVALSCRVVGESIWKVLETHSNKTNSVLKVLKPDCTYQVKVQVQCLSRVYNTNDFITLRAPEGRKHSSAATKTWKIWAEKGEIALLRTKRVSPWALELCWAGRQGCPPFSADFLGRCCISVTAVTVTHVSLVPDAPLNLQLSLKKEAEGVVMCWWSPPVNAHGLIREFIVSPAALGRGDSSTQPAAGGWWAWNEVFWGGNLLGTPGKLGEKKLQDVG